MTIKEKKLKKLVLLWEVLVREILESTEAVENELPHEQYKRVKRLEADPEEWFRFYFPRFAYAPPAPFHTEATQRVLQNPEWCEVRMWSRELAKSTRTMMEVIYLALVGHPSPEIACGDPDSYRDEPRLRKRNILLVSNSFENAVRLLMPYKANLEFNARIRQDYGPQEHIGSWTSGEFITRSGVSFRAIGAGQSPRGSRNEEVRPDVILFDDVDTDADCLNREIVAKRWRWIEEAAIGTRSISQPTTIIFCGNRIAADCTVQRATVIADHTDVINIRDEVGRSSWPQKNGELDIDRVLMQKSYAAQQKEYFNNPLTEGSVFKAMAYKPARPISEYEMLVCYTDPSYKDTGDYKATVLVGLWQQEFHIIKCYLAQATTAEMIQWHYNIMNMVKERSCYYYMEEVFMQDVILREVHDAGRRIGRFIPLVGDRRKKPDKFMRIESLLEPLQRSGDLYFNEHERQNPHMVLLEEQFVAFAPGSRAHDDGPDAVEGAVWMIMNKTGAAAGGNSIQLFPRPPGNKRF